MFGVIKPHLAEWILAPWVKMAEASTIRPVPSHFFSLSAHALSDLAHHQLTNRASFFSALRGGDICIFMNTFLESPHDGYPVFSTDQ